MICSYLRKHHDVFDGLPYMVLKKLHAEEKLTRQDWGLIMDVVYEVETRTTK